MTLLNVANETFPETLQGDARPFFIQRKLKHLDGRSVKDRADGASMLCPVRCHLETTGGKAEAVVAGEQEFFVAALNTL
jgi:hypothetical protein